MQMMSISAVIMSYASTIRSDLIREVSPLVDMMLQSQPVARTIDTFSKRSELVLAVYEHFRRV